MTRLYLTFSALALLFFIANPIAAQTKKKTPWYNIEMIIFAQENVGAGSNEIWPTLPGTPDISSVVAYDSIPNSQRRLKAIYNSLKRTNGRFQPLIHKAWRQPVVSKKRTLPIAVSATVDSFNLMGTVKISVKRYLHVDLDFLLNDSNRTTPVLQDGKSLAAYTRRPSQYRVVSHRKMRSEELHFIDHPKVGVIIKATKFIIPEAASSPSDEAEPTLQNKAAEKNIPVSN